MVSQRLIRLVEQNADRLSNDLIAEVRRDPRTSAYHQLSEEDLHGRAVDLFRNLGQWLSSRTEFAVQTRYEAFGRRRFQEKIPFSQVLFALHTSKSMLLTFLRGAAAESISELPLEYELVLSISQFYDRAIYHAGVGYEDAARAAQMPSLFPEPVVTARPVSPEATRKPLSREVNAEADLGLEVSRSGDIGESGG